MDRVARNRVDERRVRRAAERVGLVLAKCFARSATALGFGRYALRGADGALFHPQLGNQDYALALAEAEALVAAQPAVAAINDRNNVVRRHDHVERKPAPSLPFVVKPSPLRAPATCPAPAVGTPEQKAKREQDAAIQLWHLEAAAKRGMRILAGDSAARPVPVPDSQTDAFEAKRKRDLDALAQRIARRGC